MSPSESELILKNFLKEQNIPLTHFEQCNLNDINGKFDANIPNDGDWAPRLNEYLQEMTAVSPMSTNEAIRLHSLVFIEEEETFSSHFKEIACPPLNKYQISFYQYKDNNDFFILYGLQKHSHIASRGLISRGEDFAIFQTTTTEGHRIVSLSIQEKLLHLLCDGKNLFYHEMANPLFPQTRNLPTFVPQMDDSLESNVLKLGYQIRFNQRDMSVGGNDLNTILNNFSTEPVVVPKFFNAIVESILERYVQFLTDNLPTRESIDAENVTSWLLMRDKAESIMMVVGLWKESAREKLDHIDSRFPLYLTSHILPQSRLLSEAWLYDPMYWWGQGSALHSMLGESENE